MRLHNLKWLKTRRRQLRASLTTAEARLWKYLKISQLLGRKFRRQHSAGRYVLDFYCPSEKLAIELDGAAHDCDSAQHHDRIRDEFLQNAGIRILRFQNDDVMRNLDGVLSEIRRHFTTPALCATPPKLGGDEGVVSLRFFPSLIRRGGRVSGRGGQSL